MAQIVLKDASITINSVDLSSLSNNVEIVYEIEAVETTSFGGNRSFVGGLQNNSVTVEIMQDFAATKTEATIFPLVGTTTTLVFKPTTSAVGTTGTTITAGKFDTADTALPATVTARTKPGGGATTDATNPLTIFVNGSSEETIPYASQASTLNHIPLAGTPYFRPIILRETQGLKVDQTTNSSIGNINVVVVFTVE